MRRFLAKVYDALLGILLSYGIMMTIWVFGAFYFEAFPEINEKNTLFLLISMLIPWMTNFIFEYSSTLTMKGILHGGLWLMLDMILFNYMYQIALPAEVLIGIIVTSVPVYGGGLYLFSRVSAKLNMPVRCVSAFWVKALSKIQKDNL